MSELEIIELYERKSKKTTGKFIENIDSKLRIQTDIQMLEQDTNWIDIIEETIPHIDAIFRSPNRFIINDEEIVKIESAKKITVDSIKHLAKNTNLIQTVDKITGDVQPAKILNVNKEEDYDTYENRLIYTLVQKIKMFLAIKKQILEETYDEFKNNKMLHYSASSKIIDENVDIKISLSSKLDNEKDNLKKEDILKKIEEISKKVTELQTASVYKIIDKKNITWIKEPIRKTNVVLKNVHFQYAMKLWEFFKENLEGKLNKMSNQEDYMDDGDLKKLIDETFLLQYIAMRTLEQDEIEGEENMQEVKDILIEKMIDKILDMDTTTTDRELKQLIATKYEIIKYKKMEAIKEIQNIFKEHIDKYLEKIKKRGV